MKKTEEQEKKPKPIKIVLIVIAILVVAFVIITTVALFSLVAILGSVGDDIKTYGDFRYIVIDNNSIRGDDSSKFVAIVDFSDSTLEEVEIPREIEGKTVRYVGFRVASADWFAVQYYRIECPNLKKIFVYDNIKTIHKNAFDDSLGIEMMYCSITSDIPSGGYPGLSKTYIYRSLYESMDEDTARKYCIGNVEFMNNYSDEVNGGYYRLDNVEGEEKISEPPKPEREGYEFMGWYTEPECINAWDFDISPEIKEDTQFRLYAKWRAL